MKLLVSAHTAMTMTPDGALWAGHPMGYDFWKRYLDVFDEVHVLVRTRAVSAPSDSSLLVTGPGVKAAPAPYFAGVWESMTRYLAVRRAAEAALSEAEAVLLRIPQPFSQIVWSLVDSRRPYGVQVTSDPRDGLAPGANRHPLRPVMRFWFTRRVRLQCARACAVTYVTSHALPKRYPASAGAFATHFSDVVLDDASFVEAPRRPASSMSRLRIVFVGFLGEPYKAPDVLIDAAALCVKEGVDLQLEFIGGGRYQPEFEARAAARGLQDRARFLGTLHSAESIRDRLDQADLFILPSRMEGLPRAMIEAMARGLPCIGTNIAGIPELLVEEDMVPPDSVDALARKIREVAEHPGRLARMSARNLVRAQEYREASIRKRRIEFYGYLKEKTEEWMRGGGRR